MEMPPGWEKIRGCTKFGYILTESDRIEITDLIKEMAEALELISKLCDEGYKNISITASSGTIDEDDFYSCCGYPRDAADKILKKFKEWK